MLGHLWFHSVSHEGWLCLAQGIAMAVHFEREEAHCHGGSTSSLMVNGIQCSVRQCNLDPGLKAPSFKL